jgi:dienelactone hydrolase
MVRCRRLLGLVWWTCLVFAVKLSADQFAFLPHVVDTASTYSAAAVLDVNNDGRLDIVCGGWWFAAPDWQRHFLRDVEQIRGRFDDYSALPIDVNGDARLDLVSCNYRSQSLYWVEQPQDPNQPWTRHVIETPGPMETGRLADINGDGQLDVLPNGTGFAAWWELRRSADTSTGNAFWIRHDLPAEIAGHGVGCGDINGDGRADLVGPRGWLESLTAGSSDTWRFHSEFQLDTDASVPILVTDVDADGDTDLIWGRGHRIGLYWLEQVRDEEHPRSWLRHAIDTSWSQAHTLLLADLDGDGRNEVVAGKRYLGHDGKDPGEYDPLAIYWYKFDPELRVFRRGVVSLDPRIGWDLDPKAADLDADGDLDLIAPGRSGLYWLENRRIASEPTQPAPAKPIPAYANHTQVLAFQDDDRQLRPVQSLADMAIRRNHILSGMEAAMGQLPDSSQRIPLQLEIGAADDCGSFVRYRISFAAEPRDRVPAYLLLPKGSEKRRPAMLCLHQTTTLGKGEPAGLGGRASLHYARELAERGYVCLVPDYPSFGEYPFDFRRQAGHYQSGSMKAIWNNLRALDVLESLPEVDRNQIGCIGHSLGGHNSLFTAVFDQRIRAVVTSCGFTAFHDYYGGDLTGWTSDRYMPRIREVYASSPDRVPFDFHEVLAAIAPRPVFVCAPQRDDNFAVDGVRKVVAEAQKVYALAPGQDLLVADYPDCEHDFPSEVREHAYRWLDRHLR